MGAGRRHEASESDTKDIVLLTAIVVVRVSAFAPVPLRPSSHKVTKESQLPPEHIIDSITEEDP